MNWSQLNKTLTPLHTTPKKPDITFIKMSLRSIQASSSNNEPRFLLNGVCREFSCNVCIVSISIRTDTRTLCVNLLSSSFTPFTCMRSINSKQDPCYLAFKTGKLRRLGQNTLQKANTTYS